MGRKGTGQPGGWWGARRGKGVGEGERKGRREEGGGRRGNKLDDKRGSPERLRRVGIEGPKISVSRIPARWPCRLNARARFTKMTSASPSGCAVIPCCSTGDSRTKPS